MNEEDKKRVEEDGLDPDGLKMLILSLRSLLL